MKALARVLGLALALVALLGGYASAQSKDESAQFDKKQYQLTVEQSQRHLVYGLELRKQGMTAQAAEQIILAAELGKGRNPGANQVLYIMRQADEAFWKRHGSRATPGKVQAYDKKAKKLLADDQKELLELANWASGHGCDHQAGRIYGNLLAQLDEPLQFDAKGQIVLPSGTIPKATSAVLREAAVDINGRLYVRDELLSKLSDLKQLFEVSSEVVRVRTTTTLEETQDLHAMCEQLVHALVADLGAAPRQRLTLFFFGKREDYERALDALQIGAHKIVTGVAHPSPLVALVCAEGEEPDIVRGVCLHEVTHLFQYSVSYTVYPSWYAEGYADTFGGTETFTWREGKLDVGGLLARSRIDSMKVEGGTMPLSELLVADHFAQWQRGKDFGLAFYAQSWAFLRYLRTGAGAEIASRLEQWEARCVGQALGFEVGAKRSTQATAASNLFHELFGEDLPKLESGFKVWLAEL